MFNIVIALLVAASGAEAEAATTEASATPATEAVSTDAHAGHKAEQTPAKPKKICRKLEGSTGSRMNSGKVCKTEEQWKRYYAE